MQRIVLTNDKGTPYNTTVDSSGAARLDTVSHPTMAGVDAFGRQRFSLPVTLFDSQLQYGLKDEDWGELLVGGASGSSHEAASSTALLTCGIDIDDRCVRQTRRYFRYRPGKSQLILVTGNLNPNDDETRNSSRRLGYYDDNDGVFFELTPTGMRLVLRSSSSGTVVDETIEQASWSLDTCDGEGPSKFNLDPSKANIFVMDIEWLGVGAVRYGFVTEMGQIVYCHVVENANNRTTTYMSTANLPVRYEIINVNGGASESMRQVCSSVITEGGDREAAGRLRSLATDRGSTQTAINGSLRSILAVRPKLDLNGKPNRATIAFANYEIQQSSTQSGIIYVEVVKNPNMDAPLTWGATDFAALESSTDQIAYSGGTVLDRTFLVSSRQSPDSITFDINVEEYITISPDGTSQDFIVLGVQSQSGDRNVVGTVRFKVVE